MTKKTARAIVYRCRAVLDKRRELMADWSKYCLPDDESMKIT